MNHFTPSENQPLISRRTMLAGMAAMASGILLPHTGSAASKPTRYEWPRNKILRGANMPGHLSESDIAAFAELGGNLLRLSFNQKNLMERTAPYAFNEEVFEALERNLDACEKYKIAVVLDPHSAPGTQKNFTTEPGDEFWKDFRLHDQWIRLWERLAEMCKNRGEVIAAFDLLNEPSLPADATEGSPGDWNLLVRKLVKAIRAIDQSHAVMIESTCNHPGSLMTLGHDYLEAPPDDNVVYSRHMYRPMQFTSQGRTEQFPDNQPYPGTYGGEHFDKTTLAKFLAPWKAFQTKHNVPFFLGEFGALRWIGPDADRWLQDVVETCEENGWSWAYYAWREWHGWDPELSNSDRKDMKRYAETPRLAVLRKLYAKNRQSAA